MQMSHPDCRMKLHDLPGLLILDISSNIRNFPKKESAFLNDLFLSVSKLRHFAPKLWCQNYLKFTDNFFPSLIPWPMDMVHWRLVLRTNKYILDQILSRFRQYCCLDILYKSPYTDHNYEAACVICRTNYETRVNNVVCSEQHQLLLQIKSSMADHLTFVQNNSHHQTKKWLQGYLILSSYYVQSKSCIKQFATVPWTMTSWK